MTKSPIQSAAEATPLQRAGEASTWNLMDVPIPDSSVDVILWNEDRGCAIVVSAHVARSMVSANTPSHLRFNAYAWRWFDYPPSPPIGDAYAE